MEVLIALNLRGFSLREKIQAFTLKAAVCKSTPQPTEHNKTAIIYTAREMRDVIKWNAKKNYYIDEITRLLNGSINENIIKDISTHFWPMFPFYTSWKKPESQGPPGDYWGYKLGILGRNGYSVVFESHLNAASYWINIKNCKPYDKRNVNAAIKLLKNNI